MVIHVAGRLGSGKTIWCVGRILHELIFSDKFIVTNIKLVDFWDKIYSDNRVKGVLTFIKFLLSPMPTIQDYKLYLAERIGKRYKYIPDITNAMRYCKELGSGSESSRLFVWDEIHLELNARAWKSTSSEMIEFFSMSRKRGFDIIMVSQLRSAVDRQCRDLADVSYELKNLKFLRPFGLPLFPKVGLLVKRWANRGLDENKGVLVGAGLVFYKSFEGSLYDTKQILSDKSSPEPLLWYKTFKYESCSRCAYMGYYIRYSDFVSRFYLREYNSPLPDRILKKDIGGIQIDNSSN